MADRGSTRPKKSSSKRAARKGSPRLAAASKRVDSHPPRVPVPPKHFLSDKVGHFTESVIREMTRQAMLHGAVNLAQGFPDFSAPAEIKRAAQEAVAGDVNQD